MFTALTYITLHSLTLHLYNSFISLAGGNFTLAELGVCEPTPSPHPAAVPYCPDLGLLQRGYSLSAGSDADSDPEGPLSPERAIQLWAGGGRVKSRRSSGVSSRENSALTLTDSENDNKSDDESGRTDSSEKCVQDGMKVQTHWLKRKWLRDMMEWEKIEKDASGWFYMIGNVLKGLWGTILHNFVNIVKIFRPPLKKAAII